MRWDDLFDDLESQLEQGLNAEEVDLRAEEERLRLGRLSVRDRLLSIYESHGRGDDYVIRLDLASGEAVPLHPLSFGKDWVSGDIRDGSAARRQCIIPLASVAGVVVTANQVRESLTARRDESAGSLSARLGLAFVLRDLCRRRVAVEAVTATLSVRGTIDRVGRDHFDVAVHEPGSARRESAVTEYRLVPFAQLAMVRL